MSSNSFFGATCKSFITVTADNRLCFFDVESKTEKRSFVEKKHLAHTYTCFDWLGGKHSGKDYFAAGASDGTVIVWDFTRGVVITTINHGSVASAVGFSNDTESLYVASSDPVVAQYNVKTGEKVGAIKCGKKEVQRLVCNPKAALMAISARSAVKLVAMSPSGSSSTHQKKKCEGSFSGGLNSLQFSPCGCYLACASQNSREIVIYKISGGDSGARKRSGSDASAGDDEEGEGKVSIHCTVPIPGVCRTMQMLSTATKGSAGAVFVCAVLEDAGAACLIRCGTQADSSTGEVPYSVCDIAGEGVHVMSVALQHAPGQPKGSAQLQVHVATCTNTGGKASKPSFQVVSCQDGEGKLLDNVTLVQVQAQTQGAASSATAANGADADAVAVGAPSTFGPMDAAPTVTPAVADPTSSAKKSKKSKSGEHDEDAGDADADLGMSPNSKRVRFMLDQVGAPAADASAPSSSGSVNKTDGYSPLTLEKRLELLSSGSLWGESADNQEEDEEDQEQGADEEGRGRSSGSFDLTTAAPTSDSLVTLLEQALHSSDDALLEQCLACDDADVIEETSRRLPVACVVVFLRKLVAKFEKRPSRGLLLTKWLASILRHRLSFLLSVPNLAGQLAGLSQMLENRLSSYSRLASLGGRLDLLMGQVSQASGSGNAGSMEDEALVPDSPTAVAATVVAKSTHSSSTAGTPKSAKKSKAQRGTPTAVIDM